ncbi:MAG: acyltransferase [Rikenellaceae bacterium]|nr:acyltransferase [Rikenellaceae bacterium]
MIKRILRKLGILKPIDYTSIESLRKRGVKIGENVDIVGSYIDGCHGSLISIGNNVTITGVRVLAHDASTKKFLGYSKVGVVEIGDNVFIGQGSIILPNTKIGNNVIIGAGSVIAKDVPDNVVVVGNPWRVLCTFDEYIERNKIAMHNKPVFNKIFTEKTPEDWNQMIETLKKNGGAGFDL